MPGGVGEHAPPVTARLGRWPGRAQFQEEGIGLIEVVDREVKVELLWHALTRPTRCLVAVNALEADEQAVLASEPGEIAVRARVEFKAHGLPVERGQGHGIGAI